MLSREVALICRRIITKHFNDDMKEYLRLTNIAKQMYLENERVENKNIEGEQLYE